MATVLYTTELGVVEDVRKCVLHGKYKLNKKGELEVDNANRDDKKTACISDGEELSTNHTNWEKYKPKQKLFMKKRLINSIKYKEAQLGKTLNPVVTDNVSNHVSVVLAIELGAYSDLVGHKY